MWVCFWIEFVQPTVVVVAFDVVVGDDGGSRSIQMHNIQTAQAHHYCVYYLNEFNDFTWRKKKMMGSVARFDKIIKDKHEHEHEHERVSERVAKRRSKRKMCAVCTNDICFRLFEEKKM